jgi:hypothetical protein
MRNPASAACGYTMHHTRQNPPPPAGMDTHSAGMNSFLPHGQRCRGALNVILKGFPSCSSTVTHLPAGWIWSEQTGQGSMYTLSSHTALVFPSPNTQHPPHTNRTPSSTHPKTAPMPFIYQQQARYTVTWARVQTTAALPPRAMVTQAIHAL